ncbi:hypothetical protein CFC21_059643 [Triticum aestivum]|uniref:Bifunctional inhibitor/plant lipid transfer protein/seed storage helical domain-containing protein n=2 Tax=Triticum aestivum TaxID=4565 RepID=A0A9R1GS10_WHEAT|nr:cortical cell-delineating protein-like [Triticum aestivum]KAF7051406.1 hypothetical protein CFC21_059643 [Triticum aestivum]
MEPSTKLFLVLLGLNLMVTAVHGGCGPHCPTPTPPPPPSTNGGSCSIDTLKLRVCANVLKLLKLGLGVPPSERCCPLLADLADLDAAVCLCTAIRAKVLGVIKLNVPVDLVLLLNHCHKTCPPGFTCPH